MEAGGISFKERAQAHCKQNILGKIMDYKT